MSLSARNLLLWAATVTLSTSPVWGQSAPRPEVDLAITYQAERSNITPGNFFWRQGGAFELAATVSHGFGVAMNIAGASASNIQGTGIGLQSLSTTFGPRYTLYRNGGKVAVFGQGLLGESHAWTSLFPQSGGAVNDYDTFAVQVGGGIDLRLKHHFAIRPIQADWIRTEFPNATTNLQNDLRLGAGLVLRIPQ